MASGHLKKIQDIWNKRSDHLTIEDIKGFRDRISAHKDTLCKGDENTEKEFDQFIEKIDRRHRVLKQKKATVENLKNIEHNFKSNATANDIDSAFREHIKLEHIEQAWSERGGELAADGEKFDEFMEVLLNSQDDLCKETGITNIFSDSSSNFHKLNDIIQNAFKERINNLNNLDEAKAFYEKYKDEISYENLVEFKEKLDKSKSDWRNKDNEADFDAFSKSVAIDKVGSMIARLASFVLGEAQDAAKSLAKVALKIVTGIAAIAIVGIVLFSFATPVGPGLALLLAGKMLGGFLLSSIHAGTALSAVQGFWSTVTTAALAHPIITGAAAGVLASAATVLAGVGAYKLGEQVLESLNDLTEAVSDKWSELVDSVTSNDVEASETNSSRDSMSTVAANAFKDFDELIGNIEKEAEAKAENESNTGPEAGNLTFD